MLSQELIGKRMQPLKEAAPRIARIAYLGFDHPRLIAEARAAAQAPRLPAEEIID
jgi:hypothetical protein